MSLKFLQQYSVRFSFFLTLAFINLFIVGYQFGTADQNFHIPFMKQMLNPALYPNDPLLLLRNVHFSYFWNSIAALSQIFPLEMLLFTLNFLSLFLAFWALFDFFSVITKKIQVAYLSTLLFLIPKFTFSIFPVTEFSFLNRTFVFPFLLWAMIDFLKGNRLRAFVWFGLLYNLHAISVHSALFMCFAVLIFSPEKNNKIKGILQALGIFILFAAPTLLWKLSSPIVEPLIDYSWFSLIYRSVLTQVFSPIFPLQFMLLPFLSGIGAVVLFQSTYTGKSKILQDVRILFFAALFGLLTSYCFYAIFPITLLVQMQFPRIIMFLPIFVVPVAVLYAWNLYEAKKFSTAQLTIWIIGLFATPFFIITPFLLWCVTRKKIVLSYALIVLNIVCLALYYNTAQLGTSVVQVFPAKTDWHEVQWWIKDNTPLDAQFLVPPDKWWIDIADFRTLSERSPFVVLGDLLEYAFSPTYTKEWEKRFEVLFPHITDQFDGNFIKNRKIVHEAYLQIPEERIRTIANDYAVQYIVMEKTRPLPSSVR